MVLSQSDIRGQLHVYHDPFSDATQQPKIPDGKATYSLGYSTQSVSEISINASTDPDNPEKLLHMLLFPGMNASLVAVGSLEGFSPRDYFIPPFERSGTIDWTDVIAAAGARDGVITNKEGYAKWRVVSTGLQLKLLNGSEEDDGWWEACRVNEAINGQQWSLTTTNDSKQPVETGCLAPVGLCAQMAGRSIANEPSYQTGLLRDLKRLQFQLHPVADEHDFQDQVNPLSLGVQDAQYASAPVEVNFQRNSPPVTNCIKNFNDFSYDMIYIRLHCRPQIANTSNGSRFHVNVVSNQEIIYDTVDRMSRYQTKSHDIGAANMDAHQGVINDQQGAGQLIVIPNV